MSGYTEPYGLRNTEFAHFWTKPLPVPKEINEPHCFCHPDFPAPHCLNICLQKPVSALLAVPPQAAVSSISPVFQAEGIHWIL